MLASDRGCHLGCDVARCMGVSTPNWRCGLPEDADSAEPAALHSKFDGAVTPQSVYALGSTPIAIAYDRLASTLPTASSYLRRRPRTWASRTSRRRPRRRSRSS